MLFDYKCDTENGVIHVTYKDEGRVHQYVLTLNAAIATLGVNNPHVRILIDAKIKDCQIMINNCQEELEGLKESLNILKSL